MYMYAYEKTIGIEDDSIMFNNGRKNICVILCDVAGHYQEQRKERKICRDGFAVKKKT